MKIAGLAARQPRFERERAQAVATLASANLIVWIASRKMPLNILRGLNGYQQEQVKARIEDWALDHGKQFPSQVSANHHVYGLALLKFNAATVHGLSQRTFAERLMCLFNNQFVALLWIECVV